MSGVSIDRRAFLLLTGAAALAACGADPGATPADAASSPDAAGDTATPDALAPDVDAPTDALADAAPPADVASDAPLDVAADAAVDAPPDDALDAARDGAPDVASDARPNDAADAPVDVPSDASRDGPDVSPDAPRDAPADALADAPTDVAPDVTPDVAPDAPRPADDTASLPELASQFPLNVMAGDMDDTSAVLWTRYAGRDALSLRVLETDAAGATALAWEGDVAPDTNGYVHATVTGLRPGARYRYAFVARAAGRAVGRSVVGRFRTALADDGREPVTFGATSCTHASMRPFPAMAHAGSRGDLDFFAHLGDMVYCDGAADPAAFRAKYAENWSSPGFRALFTAAGLYTTWDDHEVVDNWNPETIAPSLLAAARGAYFEHRPQRRFPGAPERIWRSFRWGRTLELFVLDVRGERRPSTRSTPSAEFISRAQFDWLMAGLGRSPARFKVILNSVPILDVPGTSDGPDRWEGYASQRRALLDAITSRGVTGVWWVSGDFHFCALGRVERTGPASAMREVLTGPGGNGPAGGHTAYTAPQFDFAAGAVNYAVFRADPARDEMTVTFVGADGRALFTRSYPA